MSPSIRIAIFGNGFARSVILPCLRHVTGVELVGIASPNLERARDTARCFGIEHAAREHRDILEASRPDLVFVVTPPHRHLEQTRDALAAGCHVVCEKPTALDGGQSAAMLAAARGLEDRLTLIDHELRLDPRRRWLKEAIDGGTLGEVLHVTYVVHSAGLRDPSRPWSWWSDRDQGGGALGAIGSHVVDSIRHLCGEVKAVRGQLETLIRERPDPTSGRPREVTSDDLASAWLRLRNGALATVSISMVEGERVHRLTVSATEGTAILEEQRPLRVARGSEKLAEITIDDDLPPSSTLGIPDTDWARSFLRLARRVVSALQAGEPSVEGVATFEDGHRNQLVLDAIRRSSDQGNWISL